MNENYLDCSAITSAARVDPPHQGVIIADEKLIELYPDIFRKDLRVPLLALTAGEENKNLQQIQKIYDFLTENMVTRDSLIHVFGGGTITDAAGYAAATFKRGCRLKLYPSTLMGMVDASIGGKCAYNHHKIQNLIGSFYPAEEIIIHHGFLKSLPQKEIRQGLAEMLKLFLLLPDLPLPEIHDSPTPDIQSILSFASAKMMICRDDPHDQQSRRLLNFGHSFAHALQMASDATIAHGDAVVFGMQISVDLAHQMQMIDDETSYRLMEILQEYPLPEDSVDLVQNYGLEDLMPYIRQDKKNTNRLRLVMPVGDSFELVEIDFKQELA